MRQKDDPKFAAILDNLRFGHTTEVDVAALQTRLIDVPANTPPLEAFAQKYSELRNAGCELVCLMSYQKMVDEFNNFMLGKETAGAILELQAADSFRFMGRPASKHEAEKAKEQLRKKEEKGHTETAGVERSLKLCINARVMFRRNINVEKGLVNGAIGKVVGMTFLLGGKEVDKIRVKFDNILDVENIERITAKFAQSKQVFVTRMQFPLILSYAMTIHKAQGLSLSHVMADVGNSVFTGDSGAGMTYVALSRVRTAAGLHLMNFDPSKAKANAKCVDEINRLRSIYTPHLSPLAVSRKKLKMVPDRPWTDCLKAPLQPLATDDVPGKPQRRRSKRKAKDAGRATTPASKRKRATISETNEAPAAKRKRPNHAPTARVKKAATITAQAARGSTSTPKRFEDSAPPPADFGPESLAERLPVEPVLRPPGLHNPRNVCYSNSVMQALMSLDSFREVCENLQNAAVKPFQLELARFYREYEAQERQRVPAVLSTESLRLALAAKNRFPFGNANEQQCAREFFQVVFQKAKILEMFSIKKRDRFLCGRASCQRHEWFSNDAEVTCYLPVLPEANRTLEELIGALRLNEDKVCQKCGQKGEVKSGYEILSIPDQVLLWIWRYEASDADLAPVATFDPNHVVIGGKTYFVVAGVDHLGMSADSGHYMAHVRRGDAWWKCDDARIIAEPGLPTGLRTISFLVLQKKAAMAPAISISIL